MIIYKITNIVNQKVYIGQTVSRIERRYSSHLAEAGSTKSHKNRLYNSIRKHGKENFTIEKIDTATSIEELNRKEIHWIIFYDSMNPDRGYNIKSGGENSFCSDSHKKQISLWNKERVITEEMKKKISKTLMGRTIPIAVRQKISNSHKDKKKTSSHKNNISKALTNNPRHPNAKKVYIFLPNGEKQVSNSLKSWCTNNNFPYHMAYYYAKRGHTINNSLYNGYRFEYGET